MRWRRVSRTVSEMDSRPKAIELCDEFLHWYRYSRKGKPKSVFRRPQAVERRRRRYSRSSSLLIFPEMLESSLSARWPYYSTISSFPVKRDHCRCGNKERAVCSRQPSIRFDASPVRSLRNSPTIPASFTSIAIRHKKTITGILIFEDASTSCNLLATNLVPASIESNP